jgi:hypothetical protein
MRDRFRATLFKVAQPKVCAGFGHKLDAEERDA